MNVTYTRQIYPNNHQQNLGLTFKSNPNSVRLLFENSDFFINIKGYKKDKDWAEKIIKITDKASNAMRRNCDFDKILSKIALETKKVNPHYHGTTINHTGVLRAKRERYGNSGKWEDLVTPYFRPHSKKTSPYIQYKPRFDKIKDCPLKTEYKGVSLTRIESYKGDSIMAHGSNKKVNSALNIIRKIYKTLQQKYISQPKNVTKKSLNEINSNIAEIRWIFAHSTPWERGSDSISNSFMRALYKSMGIKTYPAAKNISFDLEAYCTELEDYKKNFPKYFEKPPKVIGNSFASKIFQFCNKLLLK